MFLNFSRCSLTCIRIERTTAHSSGKWSGRLVNLTTADKGGVTKQVNISINSKVTGIDVQTGIVFQNNVTIDNHVICNKVDLGIGS